jgi:RNA polymerase sigma factor (sigma-70 family)
MTADEDFANLIARVRSRDQAAAAALVRQYEPEIQQTVRGPLSRFRLSRLLDPRDICQWVMAAFFSRAAAGEFHLENPQELSKLLTTMARNRVLDEARKQRASRRDSRRTQDGTAEDSLELVADRGETPCQVASRQELLAEMTRRLSPDERYLAEQRVLRRDWNDLATELGSTPEALRKKLARAISRIWHELDLRTVDLA